MAAAAVKKCEVLWLLISCLVFGSSIIVNAHELVAPGGMVPHSGGGHGHGRRRGGRVRVEDPALGFFIAGSSIQSLNGLYQRVHPEDDVVAAGSVYTFRLLYKHLSSGFIMGLANGPPTEATERAAYRTVGRHRDSEWLLCDELSRALLGHEGHTIIPGSGRRWARLNDRDDGPVPDFVHYGEDDEPPLSDEKDIVDPANRWGAFKNGEEDEILPWQVIAILDESRFNQLYRAQQYYDRNIQLTIAGENLPALPFCPDSVNCTAESPPVEVVDAMEATEAVRRAMEATADGLSAEAAEEYTVALSLASVDSDGDDRGQWGIALCHARRAECRRRLRDFDGAVDDATTALRRFPRYKSAILSRGMSFIDAGRYKDATAALEELLNIDRDVEGLGGLLLAAASRERRETAMLHKRTRAQLLSRGETANCVAWRQTGRCAPDGPREPEQDKSCVEVIQSQQSGYCECQRELKAAVSGCGHETFTCAERCARAVADRRDGGNAEGATIAEPPRWENADFAGYSAASSAVDEAALTDFPNHYQREQILVECTDHYRVLGLPIDFTADELKAAFRKLSRSYHPDKSRGSTDAFQRIALAHEVLLDNKQRESFDRGADLPVAADADDIATEMERRYFPERFGFHPFGDPWETKRKIEDDRRHREEIAERQRLDLEERREERKAEALAEQAKKKTMRDAERRAQAEALEEERLERHEREL